MLGPELPAEVAKPVGFFWATKIQPDDALSCTKSKPSSFFLVLTNPTPSFYLEDTHLQVDWPGLFFNPFYSHNNWLKGFHWIFPYSPIKSSIYICDRAMAV